MSTNGKTLKFRATKLKGFTVFKNYKDKIIFQLKTFPMKLKNARKLLKQGKVKVNLSIWTSPNDNRKITTVFKVVSPEGYNASVEVISYKLPCL